MKLLILTETQAHAQYMDAFKEDKSTLKAVQDLAVDRMLDNACGSSLPKKTLDSMAKKLRRGLKNNEVVEFPEIGVKFSLGEGTLREAHKTKTIHRCDNCGNEFEEAPRMFPDIPDLTKRLTPGGVVPSAECPKCGCLAYIVKVPAKSKRG